MKKKAAFFNESAQAGGRDMLDHVYGKGRRQRVAEMTDLYPVVISSRNLADHAARLADLEVVFSTWGMPALSAEQIGHLPSLKAVFYAAGSVRDFARPLLEGGILVVSASAANAIPVAEFCLGQILLSCKGYFRNSRQRRSSAQEGIFVGPGAFGETVALIGAGQVARRLMTLLASVDLKVLAVDPYLSDGEVRALGARKVSMEEAFREAYVVSNHLPNLPTLAKVLDGRLFASMRPDATFINTGRGAQVNEAELIDVLKRRPDLTALLDVTDPEPCKPGSDLFELPNVQVSSHIAGSLNDEVVRMADFVIEEFQRWQAGLPLRYAVSLDMLETLA